MAGRLRALRRAVLTPSVSETKLATRGFRVKNQASKELLETIGETFLRGYAYAVEARAIGDAEERLEQVPSRFRGFAYEGAAMGYTMLDGLPFGGGRRVAGLLAGRGADHIYMVYVGIGWAMARLPRFRWRGIQAPDPLLRWLVLDGYGFHQAYFHTDKYVHQQYTEAAFPWPPDGPPSYSRHVIDQGIGRGMWFVAGTDPEFLADMIDKFPAERRADLYSGAGLAAGYAGGASEEELCLLAERAAGHRVQVAQGAAFAAKARLRAGLMKPHTELAAKLLCGTTAEHAARVCDEAVPGRAENGEAAPGGSAVPAYELWRRRIANQFELPGEPANEPSHR